MPERAVPKIWLRPANESDCRNIWEWRNDPRSRQSSFNSSHIPYEHHQRWFQKKIQDPDTMFFVLMTAGGRGVGYLRFDVRGQQAEVSVGLDPSEQGKGYGPKGIRLGSEQVLATGLVDRIVAYIKRDNSDSIVAFQRAGFAGTCSNTIGGDESYEMLFVGEVQRA